jgi:hypothetical protein
LRIKRLREHPKGPQKSHFIAILAVPKASR